MIVLSWQVLIANWKCTTKLLCQHFRWQLYMMRLSDPFYICIKLRLICCFLVTGSDFHVRLTDPLRPPRNYILECKISVVSENLMKK